jgi:hypothetical protein
LEKIRKVFEDVNVVDWPKWLNKGEKCKSSKEKIEGEKVQS